jgi:hypothetical protein
VLALAALLAPIATAVALRRNSRWRGVTALSVAAVVLEIVLFFRSTSSAIAPSSPT